MAPSTLILARFLYRGHALCPCSQTLIHVRHIDAVNQLHSAFAPDCVTQSWLDDSTINNTVDGCEAIERSIYIVHAKHVSSRAASVTLHVHQRPALPLTAAVAGTRSWLRLLEWSKRRARNLYPEC
jgi:hypothetical protein